MKNITNQLLTIASQFQILFLLVVSSASFTSCAVNEVKEDLTKEVQLLKKFIETNSHTPFDSLVEWNNVKSSYEVRGDKIINIPVKTEDPKRMILLKGVLSPNGEIKAFYSSYSWGITTEKNSEKKLYINYGIKGGVISAKQVETVGDYFHVSVLDLNRFQSGLDDYSHIIKTTTFDRKTGKRIYTEGVKSDVEEQEQKKI